MERSPLKNDPSIFILTTKNPVKLSKNDLIEINQTKMKLIQSKNKYLQLMANKKIVPPEYTLSSLQLLRFDSLIVKTFLIYKIFISDIIKAQNFIAKNSIKIIDSLLNIIELKEKQSYNVKCKFKELYQFLDGKYQKSSIPKTTEKIEKLTKNINFYITKFNSIGSTENYMIKRVKAQVPRVEKNNDYVGMRTLEFCQSRE